jgi:hypothetical protein
LKSQRPSDDTDSHVAPREPVDVDSQDPVLAL